MISVLLKLFFVLSVVINGGTAATSYVIPPMTTSGEDVAIIIVPSSMIPGKAYEPTARAIQAATLNQTSSSIRLWAAITGNYTVGTPNPVELPAAITGAMAALKAAGMKGSSYVGVGHGAGGIVMSRYFSDSSLDLKALVLLGAYLRRGELATYPLPCLTLSAELDGQTRISRVAVSYEQLMNLTSTNSSALYTTPVINIKGASHASFASGPMPLLVAEYDLTPEVTEKAAHAAIGQHISNFLSVTFTRGGATVAKAELSASVNESGGRLLPLLKVRDMDQQENTSPWTVGLQAVLAGDNRDKVIIVNTVEEEGSFILSKPKLVHSGNSVEVITTTLVDHVDNPYDISTFYESPRELDVKLKSHDAIKDFLQPHSLYFRGEDNMAEEVTCKTLNNLALQVALAASTPDAQRRYKTARQIHFHNDTDYYTGIQWVSTPMGLEEKDDGLYVTSIALITSTKSPITPGMFYCKVLSPYRAMEWVNVDSLRKKKPPTDRG